TADLDLRTILKNIGGPDLPDLPTVPNPTASGLPTQLPTGVPTSVPTVTATLPTVPGVTSTPVVTPTCVATVCIGAGSRAGTTSSGAFDSNLAAMMLGGLL
ncbi:MAG TPA: hypothetical protein VFR56_03510, partial [Actinomycetes bacterium]|nr:hypothetical protein [Actinomycetes bacterium]